MRDPLNPLAILPLYSLERLEMVLALVPLENGSQNAASVGNGFENAAGSI